MFAFRFFFAALLVLQSVHAQDKFKLKVGGKDLEFTEIKDLVVISGVTVTDPPADPKEEETLPIVSCTFTKNGKVFKTVSIAIHPDDRKIAEDDFKKSTGKALEYKAIIVDNGTTYTGDEKKITINYTPENNAFDDLTSSSTKFKKIEAALYFGGKFKWWMQVTTKDKVGLLATTKPGKNTPAAKTTCSIGGKKSLYVE